MLTCIKICKYHEQYADGYEGLSIIAVLGAYQANLEIPVCRINYIVRSNRNIEAHT